MNKPKLLVVDDQKTNIALLKAQFKDCEVISATEGRLALKLINENKPDLILLDINMPGINGYAFLSIIKNASETKDIPVILVTARSEPEEKVSAMQKGAMDLISKPFHPIELKTRVNSLLRSYFAIQTKKQMQSIAESFALAIDLKVSNGESHSVQVANLAYKIALKCTPNPEEQNNIYCAAILHDIGKLWLPDKVLEIRELDEQETTIFQSHTNYGAEFCEKNSLLKQLAPLVKQHHEQYDGNGYPDKLKHTEISLGARIIAIADGYVKLTTTTKDKPALSPQETLKALDLEIAVKYDPSLFLILEELNKSQLLNNL